MNWAQLNWTVAIIATPILLLLPYFHVKRKKERRENLKIMKLVAAERGRESLRGCR